MSETPETDAETMDGIDCYGDSLKSWDYKPSNDGEVVPAGFARKLERERDEARRECNEAQDGWSRALDERDDAREDLYRVDAARMREHGEAFDAFSKVVEERDEAREELARLRKGLVRLIRRWKRLEKEYLNAVTPAFQMGDKCAGSRYYGESIGTHWAIEDLQLLANQK